MIGRRALIAALAATGLPAAGRAAAPAERLFASGPLATNRLAMSFMAVAPGPAPDPRLLSAAGPRRWGELKGKPHLVSLWAEWCAPCLAEAGELARLAKAYSARGVGVLGVLTSSFKQLDLPAAQALMTQMGAQDLPIWIEPEGGHVLFERLTKLDGLPSLPCNLLLDARGVIRGRSIGSMPAVPPRGGRPGITTHQLTDADKAKMLVERPATIWSTPAATEFFDALAAGALSPSAAA